ncbi:MAG: 4-hydroxy-tetrahydrodipicolinate reductase [Chitinophagales bacterium]|nr:4-hydroxy-tetrahydrodipicolinate reductase [Chitinophagales bacterium]
MKVALIGYGKMGQAIEELLDPKKDSIVLKIDKNNYTELTSETIKEADVAIEFSNPEAAFGNIEFCLKNTIPVVSGTTGWIDKLEKIKEICRDNCGTFFYASNFSLGMNMFMHINKIMANVMNNHDQYNVIMEEIHHIHKIDAPSGTAITLADDILDEIYRKTSWSMTDSTSSKEIAISSKREGEIPGTHIIRYKCPVDTIELKHEAHNRTGFALGAIAAARFILNKRGCYGMNDLLKLNS